MSVQSEITRLENAKSAIKAAIEGKGVTVPDDTLLDGMAALIEAIQAGGGPYTKVQGNFTPTEKLSTYEIEHNLGVIPKAVIFLPRNVKLPYSSFSSSYGWTFSIFGWNGMFYNSTVGFTGNFIAEFDITGESESSIQMIRNATETKATLGGSKCGAYFFANQEYFWAAWG